MCKLNLLILAIYALEIKDSRQKTLKPLETPDRPWKSIEN